MTIHEILCKIIEYSSYILLVKYEDGRLEELSLMEALGSTMVTDPGVWEKVDDQQFHDMCARLREREAASTLTYAGMMTLDPHRINNVLWHARACRKFMDLALRETEYPKEWILIKCGFIGGRKAEYLKPSELTDAVLV